MIWQIVAGILLVTNLTTILLFLRSRRLLTRLVENKDILIPWLRVHDELKKAAQSMVIVKNVDQDGIFYREPHI